MRRRIREAVVVEGKYDKNALSQVIDAPIVTLEGFAAFHDREKLDLLRRLAEKRGLIVLTDSDGAGFVLRGWLKGSLPRDRVRQAYVPDVRGKERRKRRPGRAGLLGVEGMGPAVLLEALRRAGATFLDDPPSPADGTSPGSVRASGTDGASPTEDPITKADLYAWGLSGAEGSADRRRDLLRRLSLPRAMSANALVEVLGALYRRDEIAALLTGTDPGDAADPTARP